MKRLHQFGIAAIAALAVACMLPSPAHATSFRYWTYWTGQQNAWVFSPVGPAGRSPVDGSVEGWRFALTGVTASVAPGIAPTFDDVCKGTPAVANKKRVALIVDPGNNDDAPEGEHPPGAWALCVVADPSASGFDVLRQATTVRTDRGLICALDGYPEKECAVAVGAQTPKPAPTSQTPKPAPTSQAPTNDSSKPSRTTSATPELTPTPEATTASAAPSRSASASRSATASDWPTDEPSPSATSTRQSSSAAVAPAIEPSPSVTVTPTPSTSYSLLASPLRPQDDDNASTAVLITVLALAAIGALGFAALVRGRRSDS